MTDAELRARAVTLGFHGLVARWDELVREPWLHTVLDIEHSERRRRRAREHLGEPRPFGVDRAEQALGGPSARRSSANE